MCWEYFDCEVCHERLLCSKWCGCSCHRYDEKCKCSSDCAECQEDALYQDCKQVEFCKNEECFGSAICKFCFDPCENCGFDFCNKHLPCGRCRKRNCGFCRRELCPNPSCKGALKKKENAENIEK